MLRFAIFGVSTDGVFPLILSEEEGALLGRTDEDDVRVTFLADILVIVPLGVVVVDIPAPDFLTLELEELTLLPNPTFVAAAVAAEVAANLESTLADNDLLCSCKLPFAVGFLSMLLYLKAFTAPVASAFGDN